MHQVQRKKLAAYLQKKIMLQKPEITGVYVIDVCLLVTVANALF